MLLQADACNLLCLQGWFEFAADVDGKIENASPEDCEGKYVLDPYTFKLTFIKHHGY